MEGRTNLLPKVGGYVNGDIKNCVVANGNTIVLGDFVQLEAGTASSFTSSGAYVFKMSDERIVNLSVNFTISSYKINTINISANIYNVSKGHYDFYGSNQVVSMTGLNLPGPSEYQKNTEIVLSGQLSLDNFFISLSGMVFVFHYDSQEINVGLLKTINLNAPVNQYNLYQSVCVVNSNIIAFAKQSSSENIELLNLTTEEVKKYSSPESVDTYNYPEIFINDGKIVFCYRTSEKKTQFCFYDFDVVNESLTFITSQNISEVVLGSDYYLFQPKDGLILFYTNNSFNSKCMLYKIIDEVVTFCDSIVGNYNSNLYYKFMGVCSENKILAYKLSSEETGLFSIIIDENNYSLNQSACGLVLTGFTKDDSSTDLNKVFVYNDFYLCFWGKYNYYFTSSGGVFFQEEQGIPVEIKDYIVVKRYVSDLNGIAKTSGTAGDTIQVYVPQISS